MNKRKRINNLANLKENGSNVQHNLIFPLHFQGNLNVRLPELVERWSDTQQVLDFKVYWARTFGTFEKNGSRQTIHCPARFNGGLSPFVQRCEIIF
jgi:hypothetical protein